MAFINWTEVVMGLPSDVAVNIGGIISILRAVGIVVIIYVIYMITMGILNFKKIRRLRIIEEKIDSIEKKLDSVFPEKSNFKKSKKKS